EWTACSCSCGRGWFTRDRRIVRFSSGGGKPCIGSTREEHPCNEQPCGGQECFFGAWSSWVGCDASRPFQKTRSRDVEKAGEGCNGPLVQLGRCDALHPVDCVLEEWGAWSTCDRQCDGGQMFRERKMPGNPSLSQAAARASPSNKCDPAISNLVLELTTIVYFLRRARSPRALRTARMGSRSDTARSSSAPVGAATHARDP
ncbi:unnamed protein product, partial [Durusdinium trenchii]